MRESIIDQTDHRPYPPPDGPWIMGQHWNDLLFAHWRLPLEILRRLVPQPLEIDTFDGAAWVSVVPFIMDRVRARFLPPLPRVSRFPELNLRTYVTLGGNHGIYFFSLDCTSRPAVATARRTFHLPYFLAAMAGRWEDGWFEYRSMRTHRGAPPAFFRARYRPTGESAPAVPGTLDYWLTERYRLYALRPDDVILAGEVHHPPWQLRPAEAEIRVNTLNNGLRFDFPDEPPLLHFSSHQPVLAWRAVEARLLW